MGSMSVVLHLLLLWRFWNSMLGIGGPHKGWGCVLHPKLAEIVRWDDA